MLHKAWNVRDQTNEELENLLKFKYKEIENDFKILKKISSKEDAKKLLDEIWRSKEFVNSIELELMRREYNNGTTS